MSTDAPITERLELPVDGMTCSSCATALYPCPRPTALTRRWTDKPGVRHLDRGCGRDFTLP